MKLLKISILSIMLVLIYTSAAYAEERIGYMIGHVGQEGDLLHVIESALWFVQNMAIFGIGAVVYLLPTIIAMIRSHNRLASIAAMNVFLGVIVIGWIGALIWSFGGDTNSKGFLDRFGSTA